MSCEDLRRLEMLVDMVNRDCADVIDSSIGTGRGFRRYTFDVIDCPFDFKWAFSNNETDIIEKRLRDKLSLSCRVGIHKDIMTIMGSRPWGYGRIAEALNIPDNAVIDVTTDESDTQMIVLYERC